MFWLDSEGGKKRNKEKKLSTSRTPGNYLLSYQLELVLLLQAENLGDGFVKAIIKDHFHSSIFWRWKGDSSVQ